MSDLDDWTSVVTLELGLSHSVDRDLILNLARDVAHGVARPAAPLTAYLVGLAVGAGADPVEVARQVSNLADGWRPDAPPSDTTLD